jgi:hypothetical protein
MWGKDGDFGAVYPNSCYFTPAPGAGMGVLSLVIALIREPDIAGIETFEFAEDLRGGAPKN